MSHRAKALKAFSDAPAPGVGLCSAREVIEEAEAPANILRRQALALEELGPGSLGGRRQKVATFTRHSPRVVESLTQVASQVSHQRITRVVRLRKCSKRTKNSPLSIRRCKCAPNAKQGSFQPHLRVEEKASYVAAAPTQSGGATIIAARHRPPRHTTCKKRATTSG